MGEITQRILDRWKDVKKEAIISRKFSSTQLTRQAVELILFGLSIDNQREELIQSMQPGDDNR